MSKQTGRGRWGQGLTAGTAECGFELDHLVLEPVILNSAPIIWKLKDQGDDDLGAGEEEEQLGGCSEFFILHFIHFCSVWREHVTETVLPVTLLFLPVSSTQGRATLSAGLCSARSFSCQLPRIGSPRLLQMPRAPVLVLD